MVIALLHIKSELVDTMITFSSHNYITKIIT